MKTMHAILILALAASVNAMSTVAPSNMASSNSTNATSPGAGVMPGASNPPQLPGGLTVNTGGVSMRDMKSISASDLQSSVSSMDTSQRDQLCQGVMNGGADRATMQQIQDAGVDCFAAMSRDSSMQVDAGQAAIQLELKRASTPPGNWSASDWGTAFQSMGAAVSTSDIKSMGDSTLRELVSAGSLQGSSAFQDPSKARAMESQLKSAYGNADTWSNDTLRSMGSLLSTMDVTTLRSIPAANIKDAASGLRDISFDDPTKKAALGEQLISGLGKNTANSWSSDDVANADQYIRSNPSIVSKLSDSAITGSLSTLGSRSTDKRGATQLASRVKSMSGYDAASMDSSKVANMGHLMQGVGPSYLASLPTSAVSGALSTLANVSFSRGDASQLVDKVKGDLSSYTSSNIKELGHLITGLNSSDFDMIPASALVDSLGDIKDKDFGVDQCRKIISKVKSAGSGNLASMGSLASKCMSPDDIKDVSIGDLGLNCSSSTAISFQPDKATAKKLMEKVKEHFGNITTSNTNYTVTCIKNWDRVAALGMDAEDFENLPDNGDLASVFENLASYESDMDDKQTEAIAKRVRTYLDMDNATAVALHSSSVIEQVGKFMKHFNDSDLNAFNSTVKPDIAKKIGEANLDNMPTSDINRFKDFSLKNVLRDNTSVVTDRSNAAELDDNDVRDMGNIMMALNSTEISKMSSDAISSNINNMQSTVQGLESQKALVNRAVSQNSAFFDSSDNVVGSAGLAGGIESDKLNNMNSTVLGESLSDAASQLESRDTKDKSRSTNGFANAVSDTDKSSMSSNKEAYIQKAFTGYQTSQTSSTGRKRRQTSSITCSDVQTLGSNAVSLTTSQIDTLTSSEFTDCTETLGAITGWSSSQLSSLVTRAKAAYGSTVSSWSASNVQLLGAILAGLTDSEISSLTISSASTLSVMGTSSAFSSSQLQAGFSRFLSQVYSGTASSVTGSDLMTIGSFACGAQTSQIDAFTSANYQTAASSVGSQTTCGASQLTSYATLAKAAYGATSTWTTSTITTVGVVVGGLSNAEISALTTSQISAISTSTIAAMPASSIAAMSTTQLASFSTSQANAVTASQQNSLSSAQLNALVGAGATNLTSAAAAIRATLLMLLPLVAALLM